MGTVIEREQISVKNSPQRIILTLQRLIGTSIQVLKDANNFPVVDPGYKIDLQNVRASERRNAVDPHHTKPAMRLRVPL